MRNLIKWVAVSTLYAGIVSTAESANYAWQLVTERAPFAARDGAGALVYRGRMWLLGGWNPHDTKIFPRTTNNEVWNSTDGLHWRLVKPNTFQDDQFDATKDWEGRHTGGYAVFQDKMWLIGGDANQRHYQNDVWHSTDGANWTLANPDQPVPWGPRILYYTVVHDDKIWIMGGQTLPQNVPGDEIFYRDIWNTTDGVNWQQVKSKEPFWPQRGMIGGSAVFQGRMWVLGGGTYDTPQTPSRKMMNDVWSSADGVHWRRHTDHAPWSPRQYHDVAVFDNHLWVLEGYDRNRRINLNDVWYSADGTNWEELPNTPWAARHAASVFVYDDALWVVAGNNMQPDVWKLTRTDRPTKQ
jgi:hypothetical protein